MSEELKEVPPLLKMISIFRNKLEEAASEITTEILSPMQKVHLQASVKVTPVKPIEEQKKEPSPSTAVIDELRQYFSSELAELLTFKDEGQFVKVIPLGYLERRDFAIIASIVRDLAGQYISNGKNSHFRVPKK